MEGIKNFIRKKFHSHLYLRLHSRAVFTVLGLSFKEFRVSFRQFFTWRYPVSSLYRSLKYAFLAVVRLCLGRSIRLSYAFAAEDRLIESLLKPIITQDGFFVDVGCNHPIFFSNTFLFYKRGWKGICVDANADLIKKYSCLRPRDIAVCALISDKKEELEFIELTNNVLSSADPKYLSDMQSTGQEIVRRSKMMTKSLTEILDACNAPYSFDILSVDIEEFDLQCLRSLDFTKYSPQLIITEVEDFNPVNPDSNEVFKLLISKGYSFKGSILTNLYFTKN